MQSARLPCKNTIVDKSFLRSQNSTRLAPVRWCARGALASLLVVQDEGCPVSPPKPQRSPLRADLNCQPSSPRRHRRQSRRQRRRQRRYLTRAATAASSEARRRNTRSARSQPRQNDAAPQSSGEPPRAFVPPDAPSPALADTGGGAGGVTWSGTCAQCGAGPAPGAKLRFCAGCTTVPYCTVECQRADWAAHKLICARYARSRDAANADMAGLTSEYY
jgi:hypothetical protein